jgi:hypothetical protein
MTSTDVEMESNEDAALMNNKEQITVEFVSEAAELE